MKTLKINLFLLIAFLATSSLESQTITLAEVMVQPNSQDSAPRVDANSKGGTMQFVRNYSSSCRTNYMIQWTFSKDISTLTDGDEFEVVIECLACQSSCGKKWTSAFASGSNNMSFPINGKYPSSYNSNITAISSTGSVNGYNPGNLRHTTEFKFKIKKDVEHTGFYITMGKHKVNYVYRKGGAPTGPINCHTLLGLGKNLFSLEYGALDNKDISTWMIPTLDAALRHVIASNCLSPAYLTDLRKRMVSASTSRPFYSEISAYALSVETEITTSCSCCMSCTNE